MDDLTLPDDILETPPSEREPGSDPMPARALILARDALSALAVNVGETLRERYIPDVAQATGEERAALVDLRATLDDIVKGLTYWRTRIDLGFIHGLERLGAEEIVLPDGRKVAREMGRGSWQVRSDALAEALSALIVKGLISQDDLEGAFETVITTKADNRVLNALAKKRGPEVAGIIEAHRTWVEPSPLSAKIVWPKRS